ncbi:MAG: hypothetical protein ABIG66_02950 [Candidatus Kerfeldbacteria bacterium]
MERDLQIKTPDKKTIYGKLRGPLSKPLIIFVHGLTGHMDEHIFFNGARWFEKRGYATFRFNLYDEPKDARKLRQCSIQTHGSDIDNVIAHFAGKNVKRIALVGHSLGGPSIFMSRRRGVSAVALWDPSIIPRKFVDKGKYCSALKRYVFEWQFEFLMGRKMVDSAKDLNLIDLAPTFTQPTVLVMAGGGIMVEEGWALAKNLTKNTATAGKVVVVKGADHCFTGDGQEEQLFSATKQWFDKYK